MYAQDYDERFEINNDWPNTEVMPQWQCRILPYIKNTQIFGCPSVERQRAHDSATPVTQDWLWAVQGQGFDGKYWDIGYNHAIKGMKMAQVEPTAGILLVADNAHPAHACCWARVAYANECGVNCNLGTRDIDRNARHNGGSSIGYCDGHGKWQSAGAIRTAGQSLFRQGW